jgi:hypothetical protein
VAHVLDARADHHVVHAGRDQRRAEVDRLLGRAALAVHRGGRRLDRQTRLQPGVATDVEALLADLLDAAGDHVLDERRLDPGALDHLGVRFREQRVRVRLAVEALLRVPAPDRRPNCLDDDDVPTVSVAHGNCTLRVAFPVRVPD